MIKKIKSMILRMSVAGLLVVPMLVPAAAHAQTELQNSVCGGATELQISAEASGDCAAAGTEGEDSVNRIITTIINVFSGVVGVVAVIMIIYGGFKYITSGGDSSNIGAAKNTILFAIVGLIIVALAQIIVRFVLGRTTGAGAG
jgi:hypothetical protein